MPDFFDRLIARARPPEASDVAFAYPRLPGPFERPAAPPPDAFIETIEEVREAGPPPTGMPHPRPAPGVPPATRSDPPPLEPASIIARAPAVPGEPPPVSPAQAPARQPMPMPLATPVLIGPDASSTAPAAQPADSPSRPIADQERVTIVSRPGQEPPLAPPRPLAIPAAAVRPIQDGVPPPPEPPVVTVRIGRIEVRDATQDRRERPKNLAKRRPAPKLTLAAYLAAANAGQNTGGAR